MVLFHSVYRKHTLYFHGQLIQMCQYIWRETNFVSLSSSCNIYQPAFWRLKHKMRNMHLFIFNKQNSLLRTLIITANKNLGNNCMCIRGENIIMEFTNYIFPCQEIYIIYFPAFADRQVGVLIKMYWAR